MPMRLIFRLCLLILLPLLAACAPLAGDRAPPAEAEVAALAAAIQALDPSVAPEDAARAARIAHLYPLELARRYEITDPPVIHNTKVNMGLKPRGLCWHWAEDMETRMAQEDFTTLDLHRAIATPPLRLEHSTLVISALGDAMRDGIVLDPWRHGGRLFWARVPDDTRYAWEERQAVFDRRAGRAPGSGGAQSLQVAQ